MSPNGVSPRTSSSRRERPGERAVRTVAGTALAHPWFDRAALFALRHWFFPTSRLWAAAREANGDLRRFFDCVPMAARFDDRERLTRALSAFEQARAAASAIETEWDGTFFGPVDTAHAKREPVEAARISLRHTYNATRWKFRFLAGRTTPRVKLAISTPAEVEAIYGKALMSGLNEFTAPPAPPPKIEVSRTIITPTGRDHWLRFASPSPRMGDKVYARVSEPLGITNPPTIIFGHGICVEFDHWRGLVDESSALVRLGFRVIRPEAPWHGRRNLPGRFGGESIIASFPMGLLDAMTSATREWAVLAGWARDTSTGALAFGGSSLGALTAQFAASQAKDWIERLRPDALLLLTHTGDLCGVAMGGELTRLWINPSHVKAKGWSETLARSYLELLEPEGRLCVPAGRIVSVLGSRDTVLPFEAARALVEQWCVPEQNLFIWNRGHFSVPMTLIRNDAPLRRFAGIVSNIGT